MSELKVGDTLLVLAGSHEADDGAVCKLLKTEPDMFGEPYYLVQFANQVKWHVEVSKLQRIGSRLFPKPMTNNRI